MVWGLGNFHFRVPPWNLGQPKN